jgi:hypothetical protein
VSKVKVTGAFTTISLSAQMLMNAHPQCIDFDTRGQGHRGIESKKLAHLEAQECFGAHLHICHRPIQHTTTTVLVKISPIYHITIISSHVSILQHIGKEELFTRLM